MKKKLSDVYLNGIITSRISKEHLGSPLSWARRVLDNYLEARVNSAYEEYRGAVLHVCAELNFADHTIGVKGWPTIRLRKMIFDFGEHVMLPDMQAHLMEMETGHNKRKLIVHQTGQGKSTQIKIAYESGGIPPKIHLMGIPDKVTFLNIKLDG